MTEHVGGQLLDPSSPLLAYPRMGVYGTSYPSTDQNPYPSIAMENSAFYGSLVSSPNSFPRCISLYIVLLSEFTNLWLSISLPTLSVFLLSVFGVSHLWFSLSLPPLHLSFFYLYLVYLICGSLYLSPHTIYLSSICIWCISFVVLSISSHYVSLRQESEASQ